MLWKTPDATTNKHINPKLPTLSQHTAKNRATMFCSETGEMGMGDNTFEYYNYQNSYNNSCSSPRASAASSVSAAQYHSSSADEISLLFSALSGHQQLFFSSENLGRPINDGFVGGVGCTVGGGQNEADEYEYESEEGLEALVEEAAARSGGRGSSKRSRAAEVHNMSEKRRRSRINEKMKALQTLIPNANKTDKASMLDEAIEYLKQLQLQVQMLSMRNGMSLHPLCVPGPVQLSQLRTAFGDEENRTMHLNMAGILNANKEPPTQSVYSSNQSYVPHLSNVVNSEDTFGLEASIQAHLGPFQMPNSSKGVCSNELMQHEPIRVVHSEANPLGAAAIASLPFGAQVSDLTGHGPLETCIRGRNRKDIRPLRLIDQHHLERKKGTR